MVNDGDFWFSDVLASKFGYTESKIDTIHKEHEPFDGDQIVAQVVPRGQLTEHYSYGTHSALLKALVETGHGDVARCLISYEDLYTLYILNKNS